ncbi:MAG: hypothetical protein R3B70_04010 [Polyangiaceae bacterium]
MPPLKHYVNFDQNHEHAMRREGARVPLRVTRQLWTGFMEGFFTSAQTRRLEWEVTPDGGNIATNIVIAESQSAQQSRHNRLFANYPALSDTKAAAPPAAAFAHQITAEHQDGTFHNTLTLPHTGGDKFTVRAYKLDKNAQRTQTVETVREIETWRRVYYDFFSANQACTDLYNRIKARLASYYVPAFIELVESRTGDLPDVPLTVGTTNQLFAAKPPLDHDPNHIRLGLVDQWGRVKNETVEVPVADTGTASVAAATVTVSYDDQTQRWSFRVRLQQRSKFPNDGWLQGFTLTQQNQNDPGFTAIPRDVQEIGDPYTRVRTADDDVTITVQSPSVNGVLTANARPCVAAIRLRYHQLLGGSAGGKNIAITRLALFDQDDTDEADRGILIAFLHEIGHAVGMVDVASPNFYFDDNGGRGPHCSTATDLVPLNTDRWNEIPRDQTYTGNVYLPNVGGVGQCVMYHSRWLNMKDSVFCAECVSIMKKMRITVRQA